MRGGLPKATDLLVLLAAVENRYIMTIGRRARNAFRSLWMQIWDVKVKKD